MQESCRCVAGSVGARRDRVHLQMYLNPKIRGLSSSTGGFPIQKRLWGRTPRQTCGRMSKGRISDMFPLENSLVLGFSAKGRSMRLALVHPDAISRVRQSIPEVVAHLFPQQMFWRNNPSAFSPESQTCMNMSHQHLEAMGFWMFFEWLSDFEDAVYLILNLTHQVALEFYERTCEIVHCIVLNVPSTGHLPKLSPSGLVIGEAKRREFRVWVEFKIHSKCQDLWKNMSTQK